VGTTCITSISGTTKPPGNTTTQAVNITGDATGSCNISTVKVQGKYAFTCPDVTTAVTGVIISVTETSAAGVDAVNILGTICGAQVVDF